MKTEKNKLVLENPIRTFAEIPDLHTEVHLFGGHASQQQVYLQDDTIIIRYGNWKQPKKEERFPVADWQRAQEFYDQLYNIIAIYPDKTALKNFILKEMEPNIAYRTKPERNYYIEIDQEFNGSKFTFHSSKGGGVFSSYTPTERRQGTDYVKYYKNELEAKKALIRHLNL